MKIQVYKLLLMTLILLAGGVRCNAVVRSELVLADPFILTDGDYYYAYGTSTDLGIVYYYSKDLVTWAKGGLALNREDTDEKKWFWAPEVYKIDGRYYMYYSANSHLYVAVADSPRGPFRQEGSYLLSSVIGNEPCIDGSMFQDKKGRMWFYFVRWATEGDERIYSIRMSDPLTPMPGTMKEILHVDTDWENIWPKVVEGPFVIKEKGRYYLSYSANSYESQDYAIGYATSRKPGGTWKKHEGNPILRRWKGLVGVGHHSFFRDKDNKWRIVYHAHNSDKTIHPRVSYIGSLEFVNGEMRIVDEEILSPKVVDSLDSPSRP